MWVPQGGCCFGQKLPVEPASSPAHFESWRQKKHLFTPSSDLASFFTVADLSPPSEPWVHGRHRVIVSDPVSSVTHVCHLCSLSFRWLIVGSGEQAEQRQPEAPGSTYAVTAVTEKELPRPFPTSFLTLLSLRHIPFCPLFVWLTHSCFKT